MAQYVDYLRQYETPAPISFCLGLLLDYTGQIEERYWRGDGQAVRTEDRFLTRSMIADRRDTITRYGVNMLREVVNPTAESPSSYYYDAELVRLAHVDTGEEQPGKGITTLSYFGWTREEQFYIARSESGFRYFGPTNPQKRDFIEVVAEGPVLYVHFHYFPGSSNNVRPIRYQVWRPTSRIEDGDPRVMRAALLKTSSDIGHEEYIWQTGKIPKEADIDLVGRVLTSVRTRFDYACKHPSQRFDPTHRKY